jgi:hypothetical protein
VAVGEIELAGQLPRDDLKWVQDGHALVEEEGDGIWMLG